MDELNNKIQWRGRAAILGEDRSPAPGAPRLTPPTAAPPAPPPRPATMARRLLGLAPRLRPAAALLAPGAPSWPVQAPAAALAAPAARGFADDAGLLKTPLYDLHLEHGGAPTLPPCWGLAFCAELESL